MGIVTPFPPELCERVTNCSCQSRSSMTHSASGSLSSPSRPPRNHRSYCLHRRHRHHHRRIGSSVVTDRSAEISVDSAGSSRCCGFSFHDGGCCCGRGCGENRGSSSECETAKIAKTGSRSVLRPVHSSDFNDDFRLFRRHLTRRRMQKDVKNEEERKEEEEEEEEMMERDQVPKGRKNVVERADFLAALEPQRRFSETLDCDGTEPVPLSPEGRQLENSSLSGPDNLSKFQPQYLHHHQHHHRAIQSLKRSNLKDDRRVASASVAFQRSSFTHARRRDFDLFTTQPADVDLHTDSSSISRMNSLPFAPITSQMLSHDRDESTSCPSSSSSSSSSSSLTHLISGLFFGLPSGQLSSFDSKPENGRIRRRKINNFRNSMRSSPTLSSSSFRCSLFDARLPLFLFSVVALIGLTLSGSSQQQLRNNKQLRFGNDNDDNNRVSSASTGSRRRVGGAAARGGRELIEAGFVTVLNETRNVPCPKLGGGEIPKWLSGYFLRHTPGTYGQENRRLSGDGDEMENTGAETSSLQHLFDGLAMVSSFELRDGDVKFSNKYLQTHGYKIWEHYGKDMTKSHVAWGTTFSKMNWTQARKWRENFTEPQFYRGNPNVNFWRIGDNIQAVDESAHGLLFDVETLETKSTYLFEDSELAPGYDYSEKIIHPAHEQVDYDGSVWNVMGVYTARSPGYLYDQANWTVYRIEDGNRRVAVGSTPIGNKMFDLTKCFEHRHYPDIEDRAGYMHSFAMSKNYVILPIVPYLLDYCAVFSQKTPGHGAFFRTFMQASAGRGLKFHVMRKSDGVFVKTFTTTSDKNIFVTHQINAFEDERKKLLHVDMLTYKSADVYQTAYIESIIQEAFAGQMATIERFSISLIDFELVDRRPLSKPQPMEFPTINYDKYRQRDYQFTYLITRPYLTRSTIMKLNVKSGNVTHWGPEEGVFPSEAVFVPTPGGTAEDDGVLLSGLLDAHLRRGFILVLNATTMEEISRARAPINTPFGLHNRFFSHAEMSSSSSSAEPTIASPSYWPSFSTGGDIEKEVSAGEDDDDDDGSSTDKGSSRKGNTQTHVPGVATAVVIFKISCIHVFSILVGLSLRHRIWP